MNDIINKIREKRNGTIAGFIRRNLIMLLTAVSFCVVGFDLTTDIAEENNEIEFCTEILIHSTCPSLPISAAYQQKTEDAENNIYCNSYTLIKSSTLSETFQSRPPPPGI